MTDDARDARLRAAPTAAPAYRIVDRRGVPFGSPSGSFAKSVAPDLKNDIAIMRSEVITGTQEITTLDDVVRRKGVSYLRGMLANNALIDGLWESRKLATLGLGWQIAPASDAARDGEAKAFVDLALGRMAGTFREDIGEVLDGIAFGHAICEIDWEPWDAPGIGYRIVPRTIKALSIENFAYVMDKFGNVTGLNQTMPIRQNGLPLDRFVVARSGGKPGDPYGAPLLSKLYWEDWFLTHGRKWWAASLERYGMPTLSVTHPRTANPTTKRDALALLDELQAASGVVMSEDIKVAFLESVRTGKATYGDFADSCKEIIRTRILGQTLSSAPGDAGGGSLALGKVHEEVRQDILEADTDWCYTALQEQLVARIVGYNYADAGMPKIKAKPRDARNRTELVTIVEKLVPLGLRVPSAWAYETFGIAAPEGDEDVLVAPAPPPSPFGPGYPGDASLPPAEGEEFRMTGRSAGPTRFAVGGDEGEIPDEFVRQFSANETPAIVRGIRTVSVGLLASIREESRAVWRDIRDDLVRQVTAADAIKKKKIDIPIVPKTAALRDLAGRAMLAALASGYASAVAELDSQGAGLGEAMFAEDDAEVARFRDARLESRTHKFAEGDEIELLTSAPGFEEARAWLEGRTPMPKSEWRKLTAEAKRQSWYISTRESSEAVSTVYDVLQEALANNWDQAQFDRTVANRFTEWVGDVFGTQETIAGADHRMATVFRTNIMHALNDGRDRVFARAEDPDLATDPVVAYEYSAIMDGRTRATHAAMDGRVFLANSPVWFTWKPPAGYNCRCYRVPILASMAARMKREAVSTELPSIGGKPVAPDVGFGRSEL